MEEIHIALLGVEEGGVALSAGAVGSIRDCDG
jgi:hypothetical protein